MEVNLVAEAFKFMFLGMSIVLLFLVVMIYVLKAQAFLVTKYLPEKPKPEASISRKPATSSNNDSQITAAIAAAVQHHKNKQG